MSTTPATVNHPRASRGALLLLGGCFALSGTAALVYQTAWTRQFAIVFGTSELAVATVLAAYMGGLALGALLAERLLPRLQRPVLAYAVLELGIALSATFVVPALLWIADAGLGAMFGGQDRPPDSGHAATTLFYLLGSFLALALPTTLMGATLPMLVRYAVNDDQQIGQRIGMLYAINTAGAVVGALLTAFALLPEFGLKHTIWFAAGLNALVFLLAAALSQRVSPAKPPKGYADEALPPPPPPVHEPIFIARPGPGWVLPLMFLAGAVAFFQEVLWNRMLAHIFGSSVYAFGVMVASFLTGIALGGAVGAALARSRERAAPSLAMSLLLAAIGAALAYLLIERILPEQTGVLQNIRHFGFLALPMNALLTALLLLPMTLGVGATYPLAVRVLANDAGDAAPASARVYGWNTLGAIAGALAAGFVLIPLLRYEGAIRAAVYASALLGIGALWVLVPVKRVLAIGGSVAALAGCACFWPSAPMKLLKTSPLNVGAEGRVLYYDVGRSASVVMLSQDGGLALRTNGLPESLMDSSGSVPRFSGEFWLSPLAVIARPLTRDMLVVGFGGGVVVEGVPPSVQRIDVIELEPKVIDANRRIASLRRRDPLADPRVHLILNDARAALRLTRHRYDAIVSQPSHPWTAGASHVYTREFLQLAHEHLNQDGVFVQWMNALFLDDDLLHSLTATLLDVYKNVRVYRPDPNTLVFLASDGSLDPEKRVAQNGVPINSAPAHYARFGINNAEDLVTALVMDTDAAKDMARGASLITDDDNRLATSSVYERGMGMSAENSGRALAKGDPLQDPHSFIYGELRSQLSFPYIARRNNVFLKQDPSLADRIAHMAAILGETPEGEYTRALFFRLLGQREHAAEMLRLAIDQYPDDVTLRQEFLRDHLGELASGRATPEISALAADVRGLHAMLLGAQQYAARSQWLQVIRLDDTLAEIRWQDAWYPEALDLRVDWRTRISNPDKQVQLANEAIDLIDRTSIMSPTLPLYALRATAGLGAKRPDVVIESVSGYARLEAGLVRAGLFDAQTQRQHATSLRALLDQAAKMPRADAPRVAEVRAEITRLAAGS